MGWLSDIIDDYRDYAKGNPLGMVPYSGNIFGFANYKQQKGAKNRTKRTSEQITDLSNTLFGKNMDLVKGEFEGMDNSLTDLQGLSEMFKQQANKSYFDTTEGKALSSQIDQNTNKQRKRLSEDSNMMGLSQEAYLAGLGNINQGEGQAMSNLAAGADRRRESLYANRRGTLNQLLAGYGSKAGMKNQMYNSAFGNASNIYNTAMGQQQQAQDNANQNLGQLSQIAMMGFGGGM